MKRILLIPSVVIVMAIVLQASSCMAPSA